MGQILTWFVRRWTVEVTFEEARAHLGMETQRQWNDRAIARSTPALLSLYSIVTLVAHLLIEKGADVNHKNNRGETPLDSVTRKWNQSLQDLYAGLRALLQIEVDIDRVERARPEIAELIRKSAYI